MRLHEIIPDKSGARKKRKRIGRGRASGHGKTSGRGHKGQKSRAGSSFPIGFEGGRIPLYRTLPHRGFNNARFRTEYAIVNVSDLSKVQEEGVIDHKALVASGLIRQNARLVKLLGNGELDRSVKVQVDKCSAAARKKIEAAGGEVTVANKPQDEEPKSKEEKEK